MCTWVAILCSFAFSELSASDRNVVSSPLQITPQVLNFGRVNESEHILELSFIMSNVSDAPVEIANISSSCGCTVVNVTQQTLNAGETLSVPVKVTVLGRRGIFEQNVQINIVGSKEPIIIPVKGKIVQDIWFEQPMVQCFAKELDTVVEKTFEIRTIDYPAVQFNEKLFDESLHVEEISRVKAKDETVITFRLRMEVPLGQATVSRRLVLIPTDKNIKQLIVPVVCYRAILQSKRLEILKDRKAGNDKAVNENAELLPKSINLGLVPYGEVQHFNVKGFPEFLGSLKVVSHERLPQGTKVTLLYDGSLDNDVLDIAIHLGESQKSGLVKGIIHLQSSKDNKFAIEVLGLVGPMHTSAK